MRGRTYLDWNATAPLRPEAREALLSALDLLGNASSVHAEGRAARATIETAREDVAALVGCKPSEVVFTSGATEAARVLADTPPGCDVLVQETAHDALWVHARTDAWPGRPNGPGHTVAMGLANSETGVITRPPARIDGKVPFGEARADRLLLDVTQAAGRIPFAFSWTEADFAILSAHKIGGPKGVGALIVRDGTDIAAIVPGGGQERGRRSGTENVPGIAGFGAAARAALAELDSGAWGVVAELRNILEKAIEAEAPGTIFVGKELDRLPNTSCFISPGWKGETQVMAMDLAGFAVSAGSACSSGKVRESRVLRAMGYDAGSAASAIRVSLGTTTTRDEVLAFADAWTTAFRKRRARAA